MSGPATPPAPARRGRGGLARFAFGGDDVAADLAARPGGDGRLATLYAAHRGPAVHKWHHYIPLYERYFGPWVGRAPRLLEIGVSRGGSLGLWRDYFGPGAVIFGIDIDPRCAAFDGQAGRVRIGSQDDPAFLAAVVAEMGGLDLVLDDGSHEMAHLRASLAALFPLLSVGGLYAIEDLHTAYWPRYGGGVGAPGNFFDHLRGLIDEMHAWYIEGRAEPDEGAAGVGGIHVHDSFVVLEKVRLRRPVHSRIGGGDGGV